jgi:hypothetical protein
MINLSSTSGEASRNIWPTSPSTQLRSAMFGLLNLADHFHDREPQPVETGQVDFKFAALEQPPAGRKRLDLLRQRLQPDQTGRLKRRPRYEVLLGAPRHREFKSFTPQRQLALEGSQRSVGKHRAPGAASEYPSATSELNEARLLLTRVRCAVPCDSDEI